MRLMSNWMAAFCVISMFAFGGSAVQAETDVYEAIISGVKTKIWASSELHSKKDPGRYSPLKAFDGDAATAWVEGSPSDGLGEWVEIQFEKPQMISNVEFVNGYRKSETTFSENNRFNTAHISVNGGPSQLFRSIDLSGSATFQINKRVSSLRVTVESVIRGSKYNDLALSEIKILFAPSVPCDDAIVPDRASWAYCIQSWRPGVISAGDDTNFRLDPLITQEQLDTLRNANQLRVERLPDFEPGKVYAFRLTAGYDYDTDYFLHLIQDDSKPLLFLHQKAQSDDGGFHYTLTSGDFNNDGIPDALFQGECDYPDGCPEFPQTVRFISDEKSYFKQRIEQ